MRDSANQRKTVITNPALPPDTPSSVANDIGRLKPDAPSGQGHVDGGAVTTSRRRQQRLQQLKAIQDRRKK
jgi:hypothetical protein